MWRPTADCIWNTFLSSGKRHLMLTGGRGSGKTTLLTALWPGGAPGIVTSAVPREAVWLEERETGRRARIGVFDESLPGPENRMALCPEGLLSLGIPALERCGSSESPWAVIDEIGYLESGCGAWQAALRTLMERKRLVTVLRKQELPFLREMRCREDVLTVDLDAPFGHAGCVIMASGLGKRFGGNKLMADFRGEPLIAWALDATDGIFSRRVVVTRHPEVAALCRERGIDTVLHDLPSRSDTVRLGLEAMGDADSCLFCPGDQPLLRRETVASLALAGAADAGWIWRAGYEGVPGSPVLFPRWAFPELLTLPEGKGGGYLAKKYPERVRMVSVRDPYELKDADTPEELRALLAR